jgi:hypothetical protein
MQPKHIRDALTTFAQAMEKKLQRNDHTKSVIKPFALAGTGKEACNCDKP